MSQVESAEHQRHSLRWCRVAVRDKAAVNIQIKFIASCRVCYSSRSMSLCNRHSSTCSFESLATRSRLSTSITRCFRSAPSLSTPPCAQSAPPHAAAVQNRQFEHETHHLERREVASSHRLPRLLTAAVDAVHSAHHKALQLRQLRRLRLPLRQHHTHSRASAALPRPTPKCVHSTSNQLVTAPS